MYSKTFIGAWQVQFFVCNQFDSYIFLINFYILMFQNSGHQSSLHVLAGCVCRMNDPSGAVPAFSGQMKFFRMAG